MDCEQAALEELVSLLAYHKKSNYRCKKLPLIDTIVGIRSRDFFVDSYKRKPHLTQKTITAFCYLLKHTNNAYIMNKSISCLLHTYSPKLYKVLAGLMEKSQPIHIATRKSIIRWLGSVNRLGTRKNCNTILLKEIQHHEPTIRFTATHELGLHSLTPTVVVNILILLSQKIENAEAREGFIRVLKYSLLLKYKEDTLFYDTIATQKTYMGKQVDFSMKPATFYNVRLVKRKVYQDIRKKMMHLFRLLLNKIEGRSIGLYGIEKCTYESTHLVEYLVFLKDEDINDCLWDLIQYKKQNKFLRRGLKMFYLRLYQQAPFFLLKPSSQEALVLLYTYRFTLFLGKLLFAELPKVIFCYLFLPLKSGRWPYELLPLIYTGKNKAIYKNYASSKCLEVFEYW